MWKNNYSLFNSFYTKKVTLTNNDKKVDIRLITLGDLISNPEFNNAFRIITDTIYSKKMLKPIGISEQATRLDIVNFIIFRSFVWREYKIISNSIKHFINFLTFNKATYDSENQKIKIEDVIIDDDLFENIYYITSISQGNKVSAPIDTTDKQKLIIAEKMRATEEKIRKIKNNGKREKNNEEIEMLKVFTRIIYSFKQFTYDYLFQQTLGQILWLNQKAAAAENYDISKRAYAAGNTKKKLKFFLDE